MNVNLDLTADKLEKVRAYVYENFNYCVITISKSIILHKYFGDNCQTSSLTNAYSTASISTTSKNDKLKIYIQLTVSGYCAILQFYSKISIFITQFLQNPLSSKNYVYDLYTENINMPISSMPYCFFIEIDMVNFPVNTIIFKLTNNYKLTYLSQYCHIVKLVYLEIFNNCGIVKTNNGCTILLLDCKIPKSINLKYSVVPTKLEFEILLDITYVNVSKGNYKELVFKNDVEDAKMVPYITGLDNLGNTCYMNCALQCIVNNPHFQLFFETVFKIENFKLNPHEYPLLNATNELFKQLKFNILSNSQIKEVKAAIENYNKIFKGYNQQDSGEFLQCFLSSLDREFLVYFSTCPRYNYRKLNIKSGNNETIAQSSNGYFKNLFLGFNSTIVTCSICMESESNNFPMMGLQLNIPQEKFIQFIVKQYSFDANQIQESRSIQISTDPSLQVHRMKIDLANLMEINRHGIALAIEDQLDKSYKELKLIDHYRGMVQELIAMSSNLYCFKSNGGWNYEKRGYIFLNYGIMENEDFVHLEYSLFVFPDASDHKIEQLIEHIVKNIPKSKAAKLDTSKKGVQGGEDKFKELNNINSSESIITNPSKILDKIEEYITQYSKYFSIYKINKSIFNINQKNSLVPIKTEVQFNELLPRTNGDNLFVIWNDDCFTKNDTTINCVGSHINNSYHFSTPKQTIGFESTPLASNSSLKLQFIDSVKYLNAGETISIESLTHQLSLEDCITDYLKPVYFESNINPNLNWECEFCSSNVGEKRDIIVEYSKYLIINFNRFKQIGILSDVKNTQFVKCPLEYKFNQNGKIVSYSLICTSSHSGSLSGGHYTSTCKNSLDGKWRNFNDKFVTVLDEINIISSNTQMLMYQRTDSNINKKSLNFDDLIFKSKQLYLI